MKVEIRNNNVTITGYVNIPERKSRVMPSIRGKFTESINGGVFQRALDKADEVELLFNHRKDRKLGSTKDNLVLKEDEIGLHATATIADDEVRQLAHEGKLTGWSFGFISRSDQWSDGENGIQHRTIDDLDLLEVSIFSSTPAYYATKVEARNKIDDEIIEHRGFDNVETEVIKEQQNTEDVNPTDETQEEERLFSCSKNEHYVNTLLKLAKTKGEY